MVDIKERMQELIEHGKSKLGADVYFREAWECEYFSLNGKCFGMMGDTLITLKGDPYDNGTLREEYEDIIPGYYANKVHWNSIYLKTEELTTENIKKMIDLSYYLVFKKLTKKEKEKIIGSNTKKN